MLATLFLVFDKTLYRKQTIGNDILHFEDDCKVATRHNRIAVTIENRTKIAQLVKVVFSEAYSFYIF